MLFLTGAGDSAGMGAPLLLRHEPEYKRTNALVVLRFVRDDPMTGRVAAGAQSKPLLFDVIFDVILFAQLRRYN